jgi:hypothetical protein
MTCVLAASGDGLTVTCKSVTANEPSSRKLPFEIKKGHSITEIVASKFCYSLVCAVIEVKGDGEYEYWCMTFDPGLKVKYDAPIFAPDTKLSDIDWNQAYYRYGSSLLDKSSVDLNILAINGAFQNQGVLIVLGEVRHLQGELHIDKCLIFTQHSATPPNYSGIFRFDQVKVEQTIMSSFLDSLRDGDNTDAREPSHGTSH